MRMLSEADLDSFFVGTAVHEAGHAVVAELLGIQVTLVKVSLNPDGVGENGRVEVDENTFDEADMATAIMAAAGPAAEDMQVRSVIAHNSRNPNEYYRVRIPSLEGNDLDMVNTWLDLHHYSSPGDRRDKRDEFWRRAERILLEPENWRRVKSVCRALVEVAKEEKSGRQVAELDRAAFLRAFKGDADWGREE